MKTFKILYTHQKLKKAKTWQDGYLEYRQENKKATLLSEGKAILDSLFIKPEELVEDAEFESDRYLITLEHFHQYENQCKSSDTATSKYAQKKVSVSPSPMKKPRFQKFRAPSRLKKPEKSALNIVPANTQNFNIDKNRQADNKANKILLFSTQVLPPKNLNNISDVISPGKMLAVSQSCYGDKTERYTDNNNMFIKEMAKPNNNIFGKREDPAISSVGNIHLKRSAVDMLSLFGDVNDSQSQEEEKKEGDVESELSPTSLPNDSHFYERSEVHYQSINKFQSFQTHSKNNCQNLPVERIEFKSQQMFKKHVIQRNGRHANITRDNDNFDTQSNKSKNHVNEMYSRNNNNDKLLLDVKEGFECENLFSQEDEVMVAVNDGKYVDEHKESPTQQRTINSTLHFSAARKSFQLCRESSQSFTESPPATKLKRSSSGYFNNNNINSNCKIQSEINSDCDDFSFTKRVMANKSETEPNVVYSHGDSTNHQDEFTESTNHQEEFTESTNHQEEFTESTNHHEEFTDSTNRQEEFTESTNHQEEFTDSTNHQEEFTESTNHQEEFTDSTNHQEEFTESTNHQEEFTDSTNHQEEFTESTNHQEEFTDSTNHQEEFTESTNHQEEFTDSTNHQEEFTDSTNHHEEECIEYEQPTHYSTSLVHQTSGINPIKHNSGVRRIKKFQPPSSSALLPVKNSGKPTSPGEVNATYFSYVFPSDEQCKGKTVPTRQIRLPMNFASTNQYKEVFKCAILEHLNIIFWSVASKYRKTLEGLDLSQLYVTNNGVGGNGESTKHAMEENKPSCKHGAALLRSVKKDGRNKGRMFYTCSAGESSTGGNRCNFFQWFDDDKGGSKNTSASSIINQCRKKPTVSDFRSLMTILQSNSVQFYSNVKVTWKTFNFFNKYQQRGKNRKNDFERNRRPKKSMMLVLPLKKASSYYNKDDIWVVSNTLDFHPSTSFIAKSMFYGPNSSLELEISPLSPSPSFIAANWNDGQRCHAIQICNASTEMACLGNLEQNIRLMDVPVLPHVLSPRQQQLASSSYGAGFRVKNLSCIPWTEMDQLVQNTVQSFSLNTEQGEALKRIAVMFSSGESIQHLSCQINDITLIHGVFGAGKSFLLSVVVLFLLQVFEMVEEIIGLQPNSLKLMISSTTNVAVDRVLTCLLSHGFEDFLRVGSLRKIAKVILPNSLHADDHEDQELRELNTILQSPLTDTEKAYVKKALDAHKQGINRRRLNEVRVIGVTCAACSFPLLKNLNFQVHLLDECSQMIEPLSMVPIARFHCERLVLVGDPNQLSPTIQGSESSHSDGLELTLFERLQKAGLEAVQLRRQYRCHPSISRICSMAFYKGALTNGVTPDERHHLVEFLPPVSFVDIADGMEATSSDGSLYNHKEVDYCVKFVNKLLLEGLEPAQIGIITQYKAQVSRIVTKLGELGTAVLPSTELKGIQVSTVDAFQGAEKDIIILSCVRTKFVGFINCPRRTNVALSRAKHHLVMVGCHRLLRTDKLWFRILQFAEEGGAKFDRGQNALIGST